MNGTGIVMRATIAGTMLAMAALGAGQAMAQSAETPVVVELFTSQGCASCPPADALLGELAQRDDVIALALHVDYWDYIGWQDTLARPEYTARQYGYSHAAGSNMVYTPQIIVGGQDHVVGTRPMAVAELIEAHHDLPDPVAITVSAGAGGYEVQAEALMPPPRPRMVVQVVTYAPHQTVEIERGERAGTRGDHYNVVTSWQVVAEWDGEAPFVAQVTPQSGAPHVVIVQQAGYGPILGAARLD